MDPELGEETSRASDQIAREIRQLLTRMIAQQPIGSKYMIVSRIKMMEALEQQLRILEDQRSTLVEKERARLRTELLLRVAEEDTTRT